MSAPVPTPVAAALGVVPTIFGHVRRLPTKVVQLPIFAISSALTGFETARREYGELAERGERLIARLRGTSFDELEDRFEDSLQGTRLAKPYDAAEDALEDAAEVVTTFVRRAPTAAKRAPESARKAPAAARKAAGNTARTVGQRLDKAADSVEDLSTAAAGAADAAAAKVEQGAEKAEASIDQATDAVADKVDDVVGAVEDKVDGAADAVADKASDAATKAEQTVEKAGSNVEAAADKVETKVEKVAEKAADEAPGDDGPTADEKAQAPKGEATPKATQPDDTRIDTAASESVVETVERVSQAVGGEVLDHADLPLADYDHMTLGSLRGRMRSLDLPQLTQIRAYEKAHADRLPIVTMLDNRIAKLATDPTAPLSGGNSPSQPK